MFLPKDPSCFLIKKLIAESNFDVRGGLDKSGKKAVSFALQYLTITWNYASGTVLQPGASQTVTITINVSQYVTGVNTFTNTIYIIATQSP